MEDGVKFTVLGKCLASFVVRHPGNHNNRRAIQRYVIYVGLNLSFSLVHDER